MSHTCLRRKVFRDITHNILIIICLCIPLLSSCSGTETDTDNVTQQKKTTQKKTLIIGLIPERNIFKQLERYEPFARYIAKKTDIRISLKLLTRYGNIVKNFQTLGLDGAFLGSFTYTLVRAQVDVEPIARPEREDGTSTYYGMIFVRRDSGISTAKDMKGKVFAFVDKATTAGHLLPLAYFKENGIRDYRTFLKEVYFAGTHEDTIYDVLNKKADIGAAKNTVYFYLADADKRIDEELIILKRSPDVPQNGLALKKNIDSAVRNKIKKTLLTMHTDPDGIKILTNFGAKRLIETADSDYAPVYKYIHEIGLNLKAYDYINE